jgi:hypothetical protein
MASGGQGFGQGLNLANLYGQLGQQGFQNLFQATGLGNQLLNQFLQGEHYE